LFERLHFPLQCAITFLSTWIIFTIVSHRSNQGL
jgi:hypothetical protein